MAQILTDPISIRIFAMVAFSVGSFVLLVGPFVREG